MKNALIQLLKVKTLVTLILAGVFAYLCITGQVNAEQFMTVFAVVIAFYFGTQSEKNKSTQITFPANINDINNDGGNIE